ncbi:Polyhydroxyalkanoic acid synthase [Alloactinosynnema sp. L-07]|uniref:alpha/beta fold hydrolase n=1 Tax=Alloactinosynnema sp. L-07 TaxID=1653480 RepID=UPI00065F0251|nr:alpha/beta fold hydrolase [Alloactinosynnema sp. L-07]CRK55519.1 Polyhydroxyalkanoic acid synthase [Alloactinosynnema sp. L-07]
MVGLPTLDTVRAAAGNVAHRALVGGFADFRPLPRTAIDSGRTRSVFNYHLPEGVAADGDPTLLVPPLAVPDYCFDLRRGCSVVEHLISGGRPTYVVEYGAIGFGDRALGLEHWVEDVLPTAIRAVHEHSGGRPVHLVGWCLGGIMSILTAARMGAWPIASVTVVASPFDFRAIPLISAFRPLVEATGGYALTPLYRAFGGVPAPLVRRAFQISGLSKHVTKPVAIARNLGDRDFLAQIEAVDRFTANMVAYPGRTFAQLYHRFFRANDLADGRVTLGGVEVDTAAVKQPTLVIAGTGDNLAPPRAVRRLTELLPEAAEVRFATAPGGHLGVLTGRGARRGTWPLIDAFQARHDA